MADTDMKVYGTQLAYQGYDDGEWHYREGEEDEDLNLLHNKELRVIGDYLAYQDYYGTKRKLLGIPTGNIGTPYEVGPKGRDLYYNDHDGNERVILLRVEYDYVFKVSTYDGSGHSWLELIGEDQTELSSINRSLMAFISSASQSEKWSRSDRHVMRFDMSPFVGATIHKAYLGFYSDGKVDNLSILPSLAVYTFDESEGLYKLYQNFGSSRLSEWLSWQLIGTSGWHYLEMTDGGIDLIQQAVEAEDYVRLGIKNSYDAGASAPEWSASKVTYLNVRVTGDYSVSLFIGD